MKSICIQAGHQNTQSNCDPAIAKSTGAPGEVQFTVRVRDMLSQILLSKKNTDGSQAFTIQLVDANFNCDPNVGKKDYDLFLALHYDADVYNAPGGFADFPEPSTDAATLESQRIVKFIEQVYFTNAGIDNHEERRNANTKYYYMWKFLSARTPCAILECGVGQNAHDKVILADPMIVPNAIARSICNAFNVPFDTISPTPTPDPKDQQISDLKLQLQNAKNDTQKAKDEAAKQLSDFKTQCQIKLSTIEQAVLDMKSLL